MGSVSPAQTPQGVLSVCGMPERPLPEKLTGTRYMVLDGVQDPGNVGTILRTADAFRSDGLLLVNGCADLYNPKTVRATMGAVFRCPVWSCSVETLAALLETSGLPLYGAALRSRYCGRPGGGLPPLRRGHRQRGPGAFPGGPGPLRQDGPYPHERALRVLERGGGCRRAAVGGGQEHAVKRAPPHGGREVRGLLKYWLWLTNLRGLHNQTRLALLRHFGTPENLFYADEGEILLTEGITREQAALLRDHDLERANRILGDCQRLGLQLLTIQDAAYPARLQNIYDPPVLLYVRGAPAGDG